MGNDVSTSAGVIGAVGSVAGAVFGGLTLLYPVTAIQQRNGKYKVCGEFDRRDNTLPFDPCLNEQSKRECVERCAFNVPESELPAIEKFVKSCGAEFKKFSRFSNNKNRG